MNVALLEHPADVRSTPPAQATGQAARDRVGRTSEWIDPEGEDWFAVVYRQLVEEPALPGPSGSFSGELEHWFG